MLTTLERTYLETSKTEDASQKKNLNHRIKSKLPQINEVLTDVKLVLDNYSEDLIKEVISKETLFTVMSILERALQILDPWALGEHEEGEARAFRSWGSVLPACKPGECVIHSISRSITDEEIVFYIHLREHFEKIRFYVDPCIPDPVCRDPEYIRIQDEKAFQIAKNITNSTGKLLNVSMKAYTDDAGIDKEGRVIRSPTLIKIEQLQKMRWKPRGLVACMELPPLLREKKIPTAPKIMLSLHHDKEGTTYSLLEKGVEKTITKEEYLEAENRFIEKKTEETTP